MRFYIRNDASGSYVDVPLDSRIECGERSIDTRPLNALSFRDQCAIAAMQALISTDNYSSAAPVCAIDAFDFAESMEAERQKRGAK